MPESISEFLVALLKRLFVNLTRKIITRIPNSQESNTLVYSEIQCIYKGGIVSQRALGKLVTLNWD